MQPNYNRSVAGFMSPGDRLYYRFYVEQALICGNRKYDPGGMLGSPEYFEQSEKRFWIKAERVLKECVTINLDKP